MNNNVKLTSDIIEKIKKLPFSTETTIAELINYNPEENFIDPMEQMSILRKVCTLAEENNICLEKNMEELKMKPEYANRNLNVGFSGGEKKKNEILQMLTLNPKLAILDETDSGLDVDAIKTVSKGIKMYSNENNGVLIITHGTKILQGLHVDYVHVLVDGKIIKTSTGDLANEIEAKGYEEYKK